MFLHMTTWKKIIKQAFNAGNLVVGNQEGYLFVKTSHTIVWFPDYEIPNKVKGAIMEWTGKLPEENEIFSAGREGLQYELPWSEYYNFKKMKTAMKKRYIVTPALLGDKYQMLRFLQQAEDKTTIRVIDEAYLKLLDPGELDHMHGEGEIAGPYGTESGDMFLWKTDFCALAICGIALHKGISRAVLEAVRNVDFEGDYSGLEDA